MAAPEQQAGPSYLKLFKSRAFSSLWLGQLVSQSGDAVFDVAVVWLIWTSTGSTFLTGLAQAVVGVPAILLGPIAGVYADRLNRRDMMIASSLTQGVVTAAISVLYVTGALGYSLLVVLILALYAGAQFYLAANGAMVPRIVSRENLGAANGLFTLSTSANQMVGYSAGGLIIAAVGVAIPITYDSFTFFFAAGILLLVARSLGAPSARASTEPSAERPSFWHDFREGLSYVRGNRLFVQLMVAGLMVNGFTGAIGALLAPYATVQIHGGPQDFAAILAAFLLGSIVGSLLIGRVNFRGYVGRLLFAGIIGFGALLAVVGLATTLPEALAVITAMGVLISVVNIPIRTLVQTQVPGELLGRASTVLGTFLQAAQPAAALIAGTLALSVPISSIFIASGVVVALGSLAFYALFADLRRAKY